MSETRRGAALKEGRHDHIKNVIQEALREFLTRPENIAAMEAVSCVQGAAVEALSDPLIAEFGAEIDQLEVKQMIGYMVRQIMESRGYEAVGRRRIARPTSLFSCGLKYRRIGRSRDAFTRWFDEQVRAPDGIVDLDKLAELVKCWELEHPWKSCRNTNQLTLVARILLRKAVPESEYEPVKEPVQIVDKVAEHDNAAPSS